MLSSFYSNCLREIESRQISYIRNIGSGTCPSMESYRSLCGRVQGLEESREVLKNLYETLQKGALKTKKNNTEDEE